jgi:hypothetical protein
MFVIKGRSSESKVLYLKQNKGARIDGISLPKDPVKSLETIGVAV